MRLRYSRTRRRTPETSSSVPPSRSHCFSSFHRSLRRPVPVSSTLHVNSARRNRRSTHEITPGCIAIVGGIAPVTVNSPGPVTVNPSGSVPSTNWRLGWGPSGRRRSPHRFRETGTHFPHPLTPSFRVETELGGGGGRPVYNNRWFYYTMSPTVPSIKDVSNFMYDLEEYNS